MIIGGQLSNLRQPPSQQQQQQPQQQQHQQQQQQQHPISIKQEHGCAIGAGNGLVPGQTQLGSPVNGSDRIPGDLASSGFVDSTTYPSRPTPPSITGNELFALQEELLNGNFFWPKPFRIVFLVEFILLLWYN